MTGMLTGNKTASMAVREIRLPFPLSHYSVTSDGRVVGNWRRRVDLVGSRDKDGYVRFTLIGDDGCRHYRRRAQLICAAFHGPRPEGHEVRHLNGSNVDDRQENLAWATHAINIADKIEHGTLLTGEKNPRAILTEDMVRVIRSRPRGAPTALAKELGVTLSAVFAVQAGKTWKHVR
jgi:hypothetical protein